jgi:hypothetical protein
MMVSDPGNSSNFIPNIPVVNDPPEPNAPPLPIRHSSVPPPPGFPSHPDTPGPSNENVPNLDDAIPDPTTERQDSNISDVPNEPYLPHLNLSQHTPAEPEQNILNLPPEPQQSSSQNSRENDPIEPQQNNSLNDPSDPQTSESEVRASSSHPSDPS